MKMKISFFLVALMVLLYNPFLFAEESEKVVTVSGVGGIIDGDIATARREAIDEALRSAVEQAMGVLVDTETIVKNTLLIEDNIFMQSKGFVNHYDIIREKQIGNNYKVTIKATISLNSIKDKLTALAILQKQVNYPRIMVLVMTDKGNVGEAEKSVRVHLVRMFAEKHFNLVSAEVSKTLHSKTKLLLNVTKDTVIAAKLGLDYHAEVVLTAIVQSKKTGHDGYFETGQSHIRVEAVDPQTAKVFLSNEFSVKGAGLTADDALRMSGKKGAERIAEYSIEEIIKWWDEFKGRVFQYKIVLNNVNSYGIALEFEDMIKSIKRVESFSERHYGGGYLEMDIGYKGTKSSLQKNIYLKSRETGNLSTLDIESAPGSRIIFKLK